MRKSLAQYVAYIALMAACGVAVEAKAAAASRPDFTGVYTNYQEPGAARPARGAGQPELPFTPIAKEKIAAYQALVTPKAETPGAFCLGTGMPGSMLGSGGYPMEIIQRPDQITVLYEAHTEMRHLYLGARMIPVGDQVQDRNGYSEARWEGNTLVVNTNQLKEQVDQRYAHSDKAKIVERYHMEKGPKGENVMVSEMTMTDPVFYTQPVTATKKWTQVPNGHLMTYECDEETWDNHLAELKKQAAGSSAQASAR